MAKTLIGKVVSLLRTDDFTNSERGRALGEWVRNFMHIDTIEHEQGSDLVNRIVREYNFPARPLDDVEFLKALSKGDAVTRTAIEAMGTNVIAEMMQDPDYHSLNDRVVHNFEKQINNVYFTEMMRYAPMDVVVANADALQTMIENSSLLKDRQKEQLVTNLNELRTKAQTASVDAVTPTNTSVNNSNFNFAQMADAVNNEFSLADKMRVGYIMMLGQAAGSRLGEEILQEIEAQGSWEGTTEVLKRRVAAYDRAVTELLQSNGQAVTAYPNLFLRDSLIELIGEDAMTAENTVAAPTTTGTPDATTVTETIAETEMTSPTESTLEDEAEMFNAFNGLIDDDDDEIASLADPNEVTTTTTTTTTNTNLDQSDAELMAKAIRAILQEDNEDHHLSKEEVAAVDESDDLDQDAIDAMINSFNANNATQDPEPTTVATNSNPTATAETPISSDDPYFTALDNLRDYIVNGNVRSVDVEKIILNTNDTSVSETTTQKPSTTPSPDDKMGILKKLAKMFASTDTIDVYQSVTLAKSMLKFLDPNLEAPKDPAELLHAVQERLDLIINHQSELLDAVKNSLATERHQTSQHLLHLDDANLIDFITTRGSKETQAILVGLGAELTADILHSSYYQGAKTVSSQRRNFEDDILRTFDGLKVPKKETAKKRILKRFDGLGADSAKYKIGEVENLSWVALNEDHLKRIIDGLTTVPKKEVTKNLKAKLAEFDEIFQNVDFTRLQNLKNSKNYDLFYKKPKSHEDRVCEGFEILAAGEIGEVLSTAARQNFKDNKKGAARNASIIENTAVLDHLIDAVCKRKKISDEQAEKLHLGEKIAINKTLGGVMKKMFTSAFFTTMGVANAGLAGTTTGFTAKAAVNTLTQNAALSIPVAGLAVAGSFVVLGGVAAARNEYRDAKNAAKSNGRDKPSGREKVLIAINTAARIAPFGINVALAATLGPVGATVGALSLVGLNSLRDINKKREKLRMTQTLKWYDYAGSITKSSLMAGAMRLGSVFGASAADNINSEMTLKGRMENTVKDFKSNLANFRNSFFKKGLKDEVVVEVAPKTVEGPVQEFEQGEPHGPYQGPVGYNIYAQRTAEVPVEVTETPVAESVITPEPEVVPVVEDSPTEEIASDPVIVKDDYSDLTEKIVPDSLDDLPTEEIPVEEPEIIEEQLEEPQEMLDNSDARESVQPEKLTKSLFDNSDERLNGLKAVESNQEMVDIDDGRFANMENEFSNNDANEMLDNGDNRFGDGVESTEMTDTGDSRFDDLDNIQMTDNGDTRFSDLSANNEYQTSRTTLEAGSVKVAANPENAAGRIMVNRITLKNGLDLNATTYPSGVTVAPYMDSQGNVCNITVMHDGSAYLLKNTMVGVGNEPTVSSYYNYDLNQNTNMINNLLVNNDQNMTM